MGEKLFEIASGRFVLDKPVTINTAFSSSSVSLDQLWSRLAVFNRWTIISLILCVAIIFCLLFIKDPLLKRTSIIASVCLILWLSEAVPPYVPTLLLWSLAPIMLQPLADEYRLGNVLKWSADPVLALFLGGFTLGVAANRYGLDKQLIEMALKLSKGDRLALLSLITFITALLSMWISNIAAAALMITALRPLLVDLEKENSFRKALLIGVALGANLGGMATPIGTGPNAIAIAHVSKEQAISFIGWMGFALPLTLGMLVLSLFLLSLYFRVGGKIDLPKIEPQVGSERTFVVIAIFFITVCAWLTEPFHHVPAAIVALASAVILFGFNLLDQQDLSRLDWSTLILIAGGLTLGNLLEKSGLVNVAASSVSWSTVPYLAQLMILIFTSAILSALMSNTATVTMLVPLAASLMPSPSIAILIAVAASFGIPFVISTPPNAMVYGEGGIKTKDLMIPGMILMILGCTLLIFTGPGFLKILGIP
jgi:solute carrier family 13 (sodium-dependent dicarboxylate transporter), member 2/3/5